jgi:hypothetical protein
MSGRLLLRFFKAVLMILPVVALQKSEKGYLDPRLGNGSMLLVSQISSPLAFGFGTS